jgi:anaerobic selenocysteine-containing dehydrogenase
LFMTDTADYADIVLPATSQLEQTDLNRAYGHATLAYNEQAIAPLAESKSNWEVMGLLAKTMGFTEPWLYESPDEIIAEILTTAAAKEAAFAGITLERLREAHYLPLNLPDATPFADLNFATPSGKVEIYSAAMAAAGEDPLPGWPSPDGLAFDTAATPFQLSTPSAPLTLLTGAAHHFVTSSMANQAELIRREGAPFVEIHPDDAHSRNIGDGDLVVLENGRGWCKLKAVVSDAVRPGVVASPKGYWAKSDPFKNGEGGRNVNWTVSDALADLGGQSTFHSNQVWLRKAE